MSADLWAAFGDTASNDSPPENSNKTTERLTVTSSPPSGSPTGTAQTLKFQPPLPYSTPLSTNNHSHASTQQVPLPAPNGNTSMATTMSRGSAGVLIQTAPPLVSARAEDDWSAFEEADASRNAASVQGAKVNPWSTLSASVTSPPAPVPGEQMFDDAGVMWSADDVLDRNPAASGSISTFNSPPATTAQPSLIHMSGVDISGTDDDDDFGDFEGAEVAPPVSAPASFARVPAVAANKPAVTAAILQNRIDTRGTGTDRLIFGAIGKQAAASRLTVENAPKTRPRAISAAEKSKPLPPPPAHPQPTPPVAKDEDDDYFEHWDNFSPTTTAPMTATATASLIDIVSTASTHAENTGAAQPSAEAVSALPPSNVPPPSIILSHLTNTALPALLAANSSHQSPGPTLRTACHVLAGRKQRWKRDSHLAQSMSISAAGGAGGKSGMKLAGVDRAESVREDREALELVRVYRTKAGALRAAALRAGDKGIPELRDGAPIRVDRGGEQSQQQQHDPSAAVSGKPCVLCGLRRVERVHGADTNVYDGFGEWWIEHWGHRECRDWWQQHETSLRGR